MPTFVDSWGWSGLYAATHRSQTVPESITFDFPSTYRAGEIIFPFYCDSSVSLVANRSMEDAGRELMETRMVESHSFLISVRKQK